MTVALVSIMVFVFALIVSLPIPVMAAISIMVCIYSVRVAASDIPAPVKPPILMSRTMAVGNRLIPRYVMVMMSSSRCTDPVIPVAVCVHRVGVIIRSHLRVIGVSCPAMSRP